MIISSARLHVVLQVGKGDFRLNHPELGRVAGGVGVFRPEGGAEGIDVPESHGVGLAVQLAGDGQVGGLVEEVLGEVHLAVLRQGQVLQVQGGDLEHFSRPLAVGAGNEGSVHVYKIPLLEEPVDGIGDEAPHPEHSLEGIGPGTQMGHGTQVFQAVPLLLQGIVRGRGAFHHHGFCLELKGLLGLRGFHQSAGDHQGGSHIGFGNFLEIIQIIVIHHLQRGEKCAVMEDNEAEGLAGPDGAHPAAYADGLSCIARCVLKQIPDADRFHMHTTSLCLNLCS